MADQVPFIAFVSGVSGSGKTTLFESLSAGPDCAAGRARAVAKIPSRVASI
jgi:ABC-type lipoprotein export system ATPase subunit